MMPAGWLRKLCWAAACLVLGLTGMTPAHAYFADMGNGVRPTGMGESFVAVADDINALQYNPAGLSALDQIEFSGMYSSLYSNLDLRLYDAAHDHMGYNLLAASVPLRELQGSLGLAWKQFNTVLYQENILTLGYGRKLWAWGEALSNGWAIDLGCNIKWLQWQLQGNEFTASAETFPQDKTLQKNGFSADLGLMLRGNSHWRLGLAAQNLLPTDMGLMDTEFVPAVYRLGAAYDWHLGSPAVDSLLLSAELSNRNHEYNPKVGLESRHFHKTFALRAGANLDEFSAGASYCHAWTSAALALQVDYAFTYPWYVADTLGSHWVGMTVKWDLLNPREAQRIKEQERKLQSAQNAEGIAMDVAKSAGQFLAEAQAAANTVTAEAVDRLKNIEDQIEYAAGTAKLAAEIVQAAAADAKSSTLTAMAFRATQASAQATAALEQIKLLSRTAADQAKNLPALDAGSEPIREKPWPEKNQDKIVIGLEAKMLADFSHIADLENLIQGAADALGKRVGMRLEWRLLNPTDLRLHLRDGKLDGVVAYEADLKEYLGRGRMSPAVTAQMHGRTNQPCCLVVREDGDIRTLAQAKGEKLVLSNSLIENQLLPMFLNGNASSRAPYFRKIIKVNDAQNSLGALEMGDANVLAEYAYILDLAKSNTNLKLRVIAQTAPKPNVPLFLRTSRFPNKNTALQKLASALLEADQDPGARRLLRLFYTEKLVRVSEY